MLRVAKFDYVPCFDVDQVMVRSVLGGFVAGASAAEIAAFKDTLFLKKPHGPIDGGDGYATIERGGAAVELFHVRMIRSIGQDAGDDPALPGHF